MQKSKVFLAILDIFFLIGLMAYAFAGKDLVPFHGDESTLIALSKDYFLLMEDQDPSSILYRDPGAGWTGDRQFNRIMTGAIDSLTIGQALQLNGMSADDLNNLWEWYDPLTGRALGIYYNAGWGNLPTDAVLHTARTPSTSFFCLSILVVFMIARSISKYRWAAYGSSLLYTLTPSVLVNGRRAMQEGALLLFSALVILVTILTIKNQQNWTEKPQTPANWYALLGLVSGLAVASKHMAVIAVAVSYLVVLIAPVILRSKTTPFNWRHIFALIASGILSIEIFFLFMPIWWDPGRLILLAGLSALFFTLAWERKDWRVSAARAAAVLVVLLVTTIKPAVWPELAEPPRLMISWRSWLMDIQARQVSQFNSLPERGTYLLNQAFFASSEYFESLPWAEFKDTIAQIENYENAHLDGHGGGILVGILLVGLFILGIWALASRPFNEISLLLFLWLLVPAGVLLLTNQLPWQRYYLIIQQQLALFFGLGLAQVISLLQKKRNTVI